MVMLKLMTSFETVLETRRFTLPSSSEDHGRWHSIQHTFDQRGPTLESEAAAGKCLVMFLCDDVRITGVSLKLEV